MGFDQFAFDNTMRELFEYSDPSFPLFVWTGDFSTFADHTTSCHWHHEFEYGMLLSGELDFYIDGKYIRLRQGELIFINSNALHIATQASKCNDAVMFTVSFPPSLFTGGNDGTVFRKFFQPVLQSSVMGFTIENSVQGGTEIAELLKEIYDLDKHTYDYELQCLSIISRMWSLTLSYIKDHHKEFIQFHTGNKREAKAKDILSYIKEHYAENICIKDIARHTGISRSECFRSFRYFTNKKPIEHLTEYRLSHAANMLRETDKSIAQIATECGFSSSSYFGKLFKERYAVSPSQYK